MNKKCRICNTNIAINRWSAHMVYYHGGTSVRPFGLSIGEIDENVNAYIAKHSEEWKQPRVEPDCEYCKGKCHNVTACRRRREQARQQRHREAMAALEGTE